MCASSPGSGSRTQQGGERVAAFVLRRFAYMVLTVLVIISLTFAIMHAIPGDPFTSEKKLSPAMLENLKAKYGLDRPLHEQYIIYVKNTLQGDLGTSMYYRQRTVTSIIKQGFPVSAQLGLLAFAYALFMGMGLGVVAALNHGRTWDYGAMGLAVVGIAVPGFILGMLLQVLFSVRLDLLPVAGWGTWRHMILPAFVLGLGTLAVCARLMRSSMLDVLHQDYIRTARAKGLATGEIVWRHTLRNALLPIVTILGPALVNITTGSFLVEQIFAIPGLGKHFVQSIVNSDYTLILGTTLFYGVLLVFALFLVDLAYGLVDPRIRVVKGRD